MAEYLMSARNILEDEHLTFFVNEDKSNLCAEIVGRESTFVTDRPCCVDVIPASGICLLPPTMPIAKKEPRPERWTRWQPGN